MGKADEDLPDPLASPGRGAAQSADELLAQLASSEVDRLLAEAELERPAKPSTASASGQAVALGMPPEPDLAMITRAADAPLGEMPAGGEATDAEAMERVDAETARQLDKLFDELEPGGERAAATTVARKVEATATPVAPAAGDPGLDPNLTAQLSDLFTQLTSADGSGGAGQVSFADPEEGTGEAERQVLASELLEAAGQLAAAEEAEGVDGEGGVAWYVKPLEWLNAPLARCSDRAREVMGKVAIVTLINALAVLLYVVLVRRR